MTSATSIAQRGTIQLHSTPLRGHRPNIAITFGTEKLEWWSIIQVVDVQSVIICLAVSIQYVCVMDGQTDILRQHSPHYAYSSDGKNGPKLVSRDLSYSNCFSSDKTATLTHKLMYHGSSVVS